MKERIYLRKILPLYLLLMAVLSLAGCGRGGEEPGASAAGGEVPAGELTEVWLPEVLEVPKELGEPRYEALSGKYLWAAGNRDGSWSLWALDLESGDWRPLDYSREEPAAERIIAMAASEDRLFILSEPGLDSPERGELLTVYAGDGSLLNRCALKDEPVPSHAVAVEEKLVIGEFYDNIYVYSDTGERLYTIPANGILQGLSASEGEALACITDPFSDLTSLYRLDGEAGTLEKLATCQEENTIPPTLTCDSRKGTLLSDGVTVYEADLSAGWELKPLFNWMDYGLLDLRMDGAVRRENGEIYAQADGQLMKLTPAMGQARREITVGCFGRGGTIDRAIAAFNRKSQTYVAREKQYSMEQGELAVTQIIAGQGPDIIEISSTGPLASVTADGGTFVDLMPYLEADGEISKEDFLPAALEGMAPDGHLYLLTPALGSVDLFTGSGTVPEGNVWDMEALTALAEACGPEHTLFDLPAREAFLDLICRVAPAEFVDWKNASCSFDSGTFAQWLELGKSIDYYEYPVTQSSALQTGAPYMSDALSLLDRGEKLRLLGFPGPEGPVHLLTGAGYGVLAASKVREGAWQLLREMLSPQLQGEAGEGVFPVIASALEPALERQLQEEYDTYKRYGEDPDKYGDYESFRQALGPALDQIRELPEKGTFVPSSAALNGIIREEAERFFGGQKTAREAAESVQSRAKVFLSEQYG